MKFLHILNAECSLQNFAVELQAETQLDLDLDIFMDALNRAGGANYGTGIRE